MGKNLAEINLNAMRDERDGYRNEVKRLEQEVARLNQEAESLKAERAEHNALLEQVGYLCTVLDIAPTQGPVEMFKQACEKVRRLKEAQQQAVPEQVLALQGYIKERDEQWNAICAALGLPDKGVMLEADVVRRAQQFAADSAQALEDAKGQIKQMDEALKQALAETAQQTGVITDLRKRLDESESERRDEVMWRIESNAKADTWRDAYKALVGALHE